MRTGPVERDREREEERKREASKREEERKRHRAESESEREPESERERARETERAVLRPRHPRNSFLAAVGTLQCFWTSKKYVQLGRFWRA